MIPSNSVLRPTFSVSHSFHFQTLQWASETTRHGQVGITFLLLLPPCLFPSASSNSTEWHHPYPDRQKTEGLSSVTTSGTTIVSLPWMGEDRRWLCWRNKLVARQPPRRSTASSLASVLLQELHGAEAYSPCVPNSSSAGMRAAGSRGSQVMGQWCNRSILSYGN